MRDQVQTTVVALGALVVAVVLAPGVPAVAGAAWTQPLFGRFALGAVLGIGTGWCLRRWVPVLPVLEHELSHAAAAVLCLRRPLSISASASGGQAVYEGRGSPLIRLAPYVMPLSTVLLLPARWLVRPEALPVLVIVLGVSWGYQLFRSATDARPDQPDLRRGGVLASAAAIVCGGAVCFFAVALVCVEPALAWAWLTDLTGGG